jgi:hypothetical protein
MATMITNDCINCGACEPECPNNAISQGPTVFIIDPKLCTECVGFHDYEACAAVCPVDVCVTDPNNIETEEVLIARARALHPEINFPDNFESRFRKGQGQAAAATPTSGPPRAAVQAEGATPAPTAPTPAAAAPASGIAEAEVKYVELPAIDSWDIPLHCFKCNEVHVENVKNFAIGNVIFCPNCNKSMVVRDNSDRSSPPIVRRSSPSLSSGGKKKRKRLRPTRSASSKTYGGNSTPSAKIMMPPANRSRKARASLGVDSRS